MKKKLSILPIVVLALTMLFGTVCVWADPNITDIAISMPASCSGMTAGDVFSAIGVVGYDGSGTEYSNGIKPPRYGTQTGTVYARFETSSRNFNEGDTMTDDKYLVYLLLGVGDVPYLFYHDVANPNLIKVNGSPVRLESFLRAGDGSDQIVLIEFYYTFGAIPQAASTEKEAVAIIDRDLFKSEAPSKTAIVADSIGAKSFFDMKIHAADAQTQANQKLLAQNLVGGANTKIFVTENIYPRRDLSISENGSLKVLNWNNLPKNQPGAISAVVYNQIDGAYVIHGILDANGAATFTGFKLRPASTITICK